MAPVVFQVSKQKDKNKYHELFPVLLQEKPVRTVLKELKKKKCIETFLKFLYGFKYIKHHHIIKCKLCYCFSVYEYEYGK